LSLSHHRLGARGGDAAPGRRQSRQHRPIAIDLRHVGRARPAIAVDDLAQAVRPREITVQIVEGAIFRVDDHDGVDLRAQSASGWVAAAGGARREPVLDAPDKNHG